MMVSALHQVWRSSHRIPKRAAEESGYRGTMHPHEVQVLQRIIKQKPYLYLDEIQEELFVQTGRSRCYDCSTIWRVLRYQIKYSLQVVTDRAKQQDIEEQNNYLCALQEIVMDPKMAMFIDEMAKDHNCARRRRHWSPRRKTPICN